MNGDGRTLHGYEPEQRILRLIEARRRESRSLRDIAAELNCTDLTSRAGAPFCHQNVASILATVERHPRV